MVCFHGPPQVPWPHSTFHDPPQPSSALSWQPSHPHLSASEDMTAKHRTTGVRCNQMSVNLNQSRPSTRPCAIYFSAHSRKLRGCWRIQTQEASPLISCCQTSGALVQTTDSSSNKYSQIPIVRKWFELEGSYEQYCSKPHGGVLAHVRCLWVLRVPKHWSVLNLFLTNQADLSEFGFGRWYCQGSGDQVK